MRAIALSGFVARGISWLAVLAGMALPALADRASDVRAQISKVAEALTAGDAAEAIAPFDKSYPQYDQLRSDFEALAGAYQLLNEVDVTSEEDSAEETKVTLSWTLTLTTMTTDVSETRTAEINAVLKRNNHKWRIVSFAPISIFSPMLKQSAKVP